MNKYYIAVIDDEEDLLELVKEYLEPINAEVFTTTNAMELINYMEEQPVDLVILDLVMPVVSGIELLYTLRGHTHDLKCIAISGTSEKRLIRESILLTETYISKPFSQDRLLDEVKKALNIREH